MNISDVNGHSGRDDDNGYYDDDCKKRRNATYWFWYTSQAVCIKSCNRAFRHYGISDVYRVSSPLKVRAIDLASKKTWELLLFP